MEPSTWNVLSLPPGVRPDPEDFVRAAMHWHFGPDTGSPFWLERAKSLDFDPRTDITSLADLVRFPNVAAELRTVRAGDLIPRGYNGRPEVLGIFESGGTTGAPKRVALLKDWQQQMLSWSNDQLDAHGFPRGANWLGIVPSGPHIVGQFFRDSATTHGTHGFCVDLDPRWVKRMIAQGRRSEADDYAEHLLVQAAHVLRTQNIGVLTVTPPLLDLITRHDDLVTLVNDTVQAIRWGGTQLDPDSRRVYRTEIFPDIVFSGNYGSTMILGFAGERPGLGNDDPCVFDTLSPYTTFSVIDPETHEPVCYGERGRVVAHHVSKSFLLPNNLERDLATRIESLDGAFGDSVADIAPVARFEDEDVVEGVY